MYYIQKVTTISYLITSDAKLWLNLNLASNIHNQEPHLVLCGCVHYLILWCEKQVRIIHMLNTYLCFFNKLIFYEISEWILLSFFWHFHRKIVLDTRRQRKKNDNIFFNIFFSSNAICFFLLFSSPKGPDVTTKKKNKQIT